jgi:hypothetical protein
LASHHFDHSNVENQLQVDNNGLLQRKFEEHLSHIQGSDHIQIDHQNLIDQLQLSHYGLLKRYFEQNFFPFAKQGT